MTADDPTFDAPFTVQQYAHNTPDGDGIHQVHVVLTHMAWRNLVGDIARAILRARIAGQPISAKLAGAGSPVDTLDRADALTRLVQILAPYHPRRTWTLTPHQANVIADNLDIAAQEPSSCYVCGRYVEQPSSLTVLTGCASCSAREHGENQ